MRTLIFVLLLSTLACSKIAAQTNRDQLFDFRTETRNNPPRITSAASKKVLSAVFPKYLSDERFCKGDVGSSDAEDYLAAMRKAGQIVPAILDLATGSFTVRGEQQTAFLISVGECNASHADNFGSKRLAIFTGDKLVLNVDAEFKSGILAKTDFDANGINELLLNGGDMNQGILTETAALYEVRNRKLVNIKDFQKVYENSCATLMRGSGLQASVILIAPTRSDRMPDFPVENYRSACSRTKRWRFMSKGVMPF